MLFYSEGRFISGEEEFARIDLLHAVDYVRVLTIFNYSAGCLCKYPPRMFKYFPEISQFTPKKGKLSTGLCKKTQKVIIPGNSCKQNPQDLSRANLRKADCVHLAEAH